MGVYIKGMEMPRGFKDIRIYEDGRIVSKSLHTYGEEIATAVPVPEHGDLVDRREAIIDANERAYDFWLSDDEVNATIQFLKEQPTIIPANDEVKE